MALGGLQQVAMKPHVAAVRTGGGGGTCKAVWGRLPRAAVGSILVCAN